jgi:uncharacterized protein (TIGR04168 family)
LKIACFGDLHASLAPGELAAVEGEGYDLLVFVGDLPRWHHRDLLSVARRLASLGPRAVVLPGNHDGPSPLGVLLEALGGPWRWGATARLSRRLARLGEALAPAQLGGYRRFEAGDGVVATGRPLAMDGRRLSFGPWLKDRFGVVDWVSAQERLYRLAPTKPAPWVLVAHNGPAGLGRAGPFAARGRDLGDPDLSAALARWQGEGRAPLAVVAGHVHHAGPGPRLAWLGPTPIFNLAIAPRVRGGQGAHLALEVLRGGPRPALRASWVWAGVGPSRRSLVDLDDAIGLEGRLGG